MTESGFCYMPVWAVSFIWFVLFVWLNETNQMNQINQTNKTNQTDQTDQIDQIDQTDQSNQAAVMLRASTAGMTVRVVFLRHAAPARRFLAACREGADRHQGCRERSPR